MPTKNLTDLFCERVKPPATGRVEYFDASFGGLALRVTESGHKSFSVHFRMNGKLRRYTLGRYPAIRPAQARRDASAALELARTGTDPTAAKRAKRYEIPPDADTVRTVVDDYLDRHMAKNTAPGTYAEAQRTMKCDILPKWRDRPIASITRREVIALVDDIVARGADVQANRVLARLRALFNWAVEKGRLASSPIEGMKLPTKEHARDRALSNDEICWFWQAAESIGWPFGPIAKLLLLTAQRRDEVAGMEWSELDLGKRAWTLPRGRAKNNRVHEIHLSDAAMAVIKALPRIGEQYVFTTNGVGPVAGFSRSKRRIDVAMRDGRREALGIPADHELLPDEIPHWTFHDLRRTAATGMAQLSVTPHVVDRILNHVSGTIRGVAAVYNRFEYLNERREALDAWGQFVLTLVTPAPANVVALPA